MGIDKDIIRKYLDGSATPTELALIEEWIDDLDLHKDLSSDELKRHIKSLDSRIKNNQERSITIWKWVGAVAASIIFCLITYSTYKIYYVEKDNQLVLENIKAPTSTNGVIVLDNQTEINIDSIKIGDTIMSDGYAITKLANGELDYILSDRNTSQVYNIIRTKQGGIAQLKLSDGSVVWLNANSELKYPIEFDDKYREVELKGEGYFEITSSNDVQGKAFYVRSDNQTIKVLGTKFNVNSSSITALIEGKIAIANAKVDPSKLSKADYNISMKANQLYNGNSVLNDVDIQRYIDWKDGFFDLNNQTIHEISLKLSKWYGVNIIVDNEVTDVNLFGKISRKKDLKEVINLIEEVASVKFEVSGNSIRVIKN